MTVTTSDVETFSTPEAAEITGRAYLTIWRHIQNGKLHAVKSGHDYIITRPDLQKYVDEYVNRAHIELP